MKIGLRIKELMIKENIEISELAKRLGKSKQAIYDILDKEDINTSLLRELSSILNAPIASFFEDSSKNQEAKGNSNVVVGRDNTGNISITECQDKLDDALLEIKHLQERLKDKEEMIEILKSQLGK
ncbi:XRE family transcriptional regulator [Bacteroides sp. AF16-49]|uniref:helix-turn-helix domain-containing protein n=1 Tax=Bacteroides sp. AF16-49 TaxID=2292192 RepID=UPI000F005742|nr:helix-turn-helix transcriptional regulator [Bacteroides sp. AF16-49]RHR72423.1 XRE family transcriptional regulator [Bacteroides sp. AF16-49]